MAQTIPAVFVNNGAVIPTTAGSDIDSGSVVVVGSIVGVATQPIANGETGNIAIDGVFDVPKATGGSTAITAGTPLYWASAGNATATSTGNTFMGHAIAAAADADTTVRVKLSR